MNSLLSIIFALGAIITVVESTGMDDTNLRGMTATRMAMADFLSEIVYGDKQDGEEVYNKLRPKDRANIGKEALEYGFKVTYDPPEDSDKKVLKDQLTDYSATILAALEIEFTNNVAKFLTFFGIAKKSVSNAIIAIPKFKGEEEWDDKNKEKRKPICAVAFRGSTREGEYLDDISQEKGWILLGDDSADRKTITTLNKGNDQDYANKHYLRVNNALYNRFKGFVLPTVQLQEHYPYIKRYGRWIGMSKTDPDRNMPLQNILIDLMEAGKCSKKEVWVTGHSLGGAFSSFFSMGLKYGMMRPEDAKDSKWGTRNIVQAAKTSMKDVNYQVMYSLKKSLDEKKLLDDRSINPKIKTITIGGLPIFAKDPKYQAYSCPPQDWGADNYRTIGVTWDDQLYDGAGTISNIAFGASQLYYCSAGWSLDINSMVKKEDRGGLVESEELVKHGIGFPFDPVQGARTTGGQKVHKLLEVGCKYDSTEGWREWRGSTGTTRSMLLTGLLTDSKAPLHDPLIHVLVWAKKASEKLDLDNIPGADPEKWCKLEGRKTRSHWCSAGSSSHSAIAGPVESSPAIKIKSSFQDTSAHSAFFFVGAFLAGAFTTAAYFKLDNRKYSWHFENLLEEEF